MKMPRRQYEALVYLFQKVNNTRWLARLRKMKDAPNLMECLIRRTKRKQNKKSIVYKQKALKPKKRPKGPKRVVLKKRKPKVNKRIERIRLGAKRRREKHGKKRRRRSVDEIVYSEDHDKNIVGNKYIDIKELDIGHDLERFKRSLEIDEVKLVRKKRNVEKVSDDLLHDFEMNPTDMHEENVQSQGMADQSDSEYERDMKIEDDHTYDEHNTGTTIRMTPRPRLAPKLWMTKELIEQIHIRDSLFFQSKYHDKDNATLRHMYIKQRNKVNRILFKAKNQYTKRLYYQGTNQLNESVALLQVQKRRLNDELQIILRNLKCPHCQRYYNESSSLSPTFKPAIGRKHYTYVTKNVPFSNGGMHWLKGMRKFTTIGVKTKIRNSSIVVFQTR
ncbi:uncharacterized protein LOC103509669 [Diaphorina citri]|uniref:Uncharacterized protein LOC103509669 n=2 Tax=Diaphorina citri TaxID=121845 RepID=A0A3Q0IU49_DIACI|nr:uncharacterized protein LOC103509669 [Diaphorina citri]